MLKSINYEQLKRLLEYDINTGIFTWKLSQGRAKTGTVAGALNSEGYLQICIYGYRYLAHRLAWLYTHKSWPVSDLDHKIKLKLIIVLTTYVK